MFACSCASKIPRGLFAPFANRLMILHPNTKSWENQIYMSASSSESIIKRMVSRKAKRNHNQHFGLKVNYDYETQSEKKTLWEQIQTRIYLDGLDLCTQSFVVLMFAYFRVLPTLGHLLIQLKSMCKHARTQTHMHARSQTTNTHTQAWRTLNLIQCAHTRTYNSRTMTRASHRTVRLAATKTDDCIKGFERKRLEHC